MIFRNLVDGDWTFGKGKENYLFAQNAISMNIKTRLLSFLNDCFFDMGAGIDWFTYLGVPNKSDEIILRSRVIILQSYGVVKINSLVNQLSSTRQLSLEYNIDTIYTQNFKQQLEVVNYV